MKCYATGKSMEGVHMKLLQNKTKQNITKTKQNKTKNTAMTVSPPSSLISRSFMKPKVKVKFEQIFFSKKHFGFGYRFPILQKYIRLSFKGECTPNQKPACFVCHLKIVINCFFEKWYAYYSKLSQKLKNNITISVGSAVVKGSQLGAFCPWAIWYSVGPPTVTLNSNSAILKSWNCFQLD